MKLLSVAVPCYNSAAYMRRCVDSLLPGGEEVEILIIDDGSADDTLSIARDYEQKHPGVVRAIHQENAGHGGAINTALRHASGLYFKVVDSDDWVLSLIHISLASTATEKLVMAAAVSSVRPGRSRVAR